MSKRSLSVFPFLLALFVLGPASTRLHAGSQSDKTVDPGSQPVQHATHQEMALLDKLAGRWTVRQTLWDAQGKSPAIDKGTATFTRVLGGRHLQQVLHIDSATPFDGLGFLGYDDATGTFDSLWMDVNFGGAILAHGDFDPTHGTYTFQGTVPDPSRRGTTSPLREVMQIRDADHITYDYYERHDDKEALAVRLEYTRMK